MMASGGIDVVRPVCSALLGLFGSTVQLHNLYDNFKLVKLKFFGVVKLFSGYFFRVTRG